MGDVVNLNKFRKERGKAAAKADAVEARAKHGQPREIKSRLQIELEKARRELDGARRDPPTS
jgi:hypothetical protein